MKKVLIIADLFHASPRIPGLAKYFPEFGWQATIITGTLPEALDQKFQVIQTPFPDIVASWKKRLHLNSDKGFQEQIGIPFTAREDKKSFSNRLTTSARGVVAYPDEHKNWESSALKAANELFRKAKIDAIISSSSPVTSHIIAKKLKDKYRAFWIADLRDLWTQNHNYRFGKIRRFFERRLELRTLRKADALITVSPIWAEQLKALHNRDFVHLITNGFDPAEVNRGQVDLTSKFTITYTGQIYTGKQDSATFFAALKDLISERGINRKDIEVRFYGSENELLRREIKVYGLSDIVKQCGLVSRKTSFEKQRESQLLLLFYWNDPSVKGWYPLKVFEYLAAQRPLLVVGGSGNDVVEKLLDGTKAGAYCKTVEDIKNSLRKKYLEYGQYGRIAYKGDRGKINRYDYRQMASKFAAILNKQK